MARKQDSTPMEERSSLPSPVVPSAIRGGLLFIGAQIQTFTSVMLIGILSGTYSSLFVAPSLLVIWERREWRRLLPFGSRDR